MNIYGCSCGTPLRETCSGMFTNHLGECLGNFAYNFPSNNAFYVEIMGVIPAMEYVVSYNWSKFVVEDRFNVTC